jgi:CheY-like chemotaxis protein
MTTRGAGDSTILIADDDQTARRFLESLLNAEGYRVAVAQDGLEALERIQESRPDLCIVDFDMPRMNGLETCRRIKGTHETRLLPVILVTGLLPEDERKPAPSGPGATIFFPNPTKRTPCCRGSGLCCASKASPTSWKTPRTSS